MYIYHVIQYGAEWSIQSTRKKTIPLCVWELVYTPKQHFNGKITIHHEIEGYLVANLQTKSHATHNYGPTWSHIWGPVRFGSVQNLNKLGSFHITTMKGLILKMATLQIIGRTAVWMRNIPTWRPAAPPFYCNHVCFLFTIVESHSQISCLV